MAPPTTNHHPTTFFWFLSADLFITGWTHLSCVQLLFQSITEITAHSTQIRTPQFTEALGDKCFEQLDLVLSKGENLRLAELKKTGLNTLMTRLPQFLGEPKPTLAHHLGDGAPQSAQSCTHSGDGFDARRNMTMYTRHL